MIKNIIVVISFLFLSISMNAGGGWPQPKGNGYFKLSQWWVVADQHFTDLGLIDPNVTTGLFNTSLYAEYGITDRLTGIAYVPFFSRTYFNNTVSSTTNEVIVPGEAINAFGDTDIGIKYGIIKDKPIVLSATAFLGLPLGNSSGGSMGILQTGDGEFNQMLQIDASTSFNIKKNNAYVSAYAAFNNRTKGFSDEFRYSVEGGINLFNKKVWVIGRLIGVKSLKNGNAEIAANNMSVFANNSEHLSFAPEIAYNFNEKWGVSASYATALQGRIIFANPAYSVGVFYNLK